MIELVYQIQSEDISSEDTKTKSGSVVIEYRTKSRRKIFIRYVKSTLGILLVASAVAVLAATLLFSVLEVSGSSMEPTLHEHDILLMVKSDSFDYGDLCVFYYENKLLLKRVIGLPGDSIQISIDGQVSVNGKDIDEPYITEAFRGECDITFPYIVPEGSMFVLGDNREVSIDSRKEQPGVINEEKIEGKAVFRLFPLSNIRLL